METKEIPGILKVPVMKIRSFVGYYLQGSSHPLLKFFEFAGTLAEAGVRFKNHCRIMEYKFIRVRPHIVDLDYQEKMKLTVDGWSEDGEVFEALSQEEENRKSKIAELNRK